MAKENTTLLIGYVFQKEGIKNPRISIDQNGNILDGRIWMLTCRRSYLSNEILYAGNLRWDTPMIFSRYPHFVEEKMMNVETGDLILVKGNLCTKDTPKKTKCPYCGTVNVKEGGVIVYIDPIDIQVLEKNVNPEDARKRIQTMSEESNMSMVMGTLVRDPEFYEDPKTHIRNCKFQLAVPRKRHIVSDEPDKIVDFPWVKTFGPQAMEYAETLQKDSQVYIHGAIETRDVDVLIDCENCGHKFKRKNLSIEIVPYHVEYMKNCNIPEKEDLESESITSEE